MHGKKKYNKGQSSLSTFLAIMIFQISVLFILSLYADWNSELNCPNDTFLTFTGGNITENITYTSWTQKVTDSRCSGLPSWVYLVSFTPTLIAIIVYVAPFIGGG